VPADTGAWRILGDENLLQAAVRDCRESFCARAKSDQKIRYFARPPLLKS
jgi:hypothetical protein